MRALADFLTRYPLHLIRRSRLQWSDLASTSLVLSYCVKIMTTLTPIITMSGKLMRTRRVLVNIEITTCAPHLCTTADAAVSGLVIIGLVAGRQFGWIWMDPLMGLIATVVIMSWSWSLVRAAGAVLLDVSPDPVLSAKIAARLEQRGDRISDLHLWRVGPGHIAAVVSVVSDHPETSSAYKKRLSDLPGLSHLTIEVERCPSVHGLGWGAYRCATMTHSGSQR